MQASRSVWPVTARKVRAVSAVASRGHPGVPTRKTETLRSGAATAAVPMASAGRGSGVGRHRAIGHPACGVATPFFGPFTTGEAGSRSTGDTGPVRATERAPRTEVWPVSTERHPSTSGVAEADSTHALRRGTRPSRRKVEAHRHAPEASTPLLRGVAATGSRGHPSCRCRPKARVRANGVP